MSFIGVIKKFELGPHFKNYRGFLQNWILKTVTMRDGIKSFRTVANKKKYLNSFICAKTVSSEELWM